MLKFFRITAVLLLLVWMIFIFLLSAQTADESSEMSGSLIAAVVKVFNPNFDELTEAEKEELIEDFQFIVRKGAHFTAYAVLGVLSFLSVITYKKIPFNIRAAIGWVVCLLYSVGDEIHQTFIPGRSGEVRDVCIDVCGSALAILVCGVLGKKIKAFKKHI